MDVVAEQSLKRRRWDRLRDDDDGIPEPPLIRPARGGLRSTGGSTTADGERREKGEERASENGRE
jgi:hypothetical protein